MRSELVATHKLGDLYKTDTKMGSDMPTCKEHMKYYGIIGLQGTSVLQKSILTDFRLFLM